jgi:hypothetical protein
MPDSNSSMIKPVDGLPNVASVTPAKERHERKRKQQAFGDEKSEYHERSDADEELEDSAPGDDGEQHVIDYRA